MNEQRFPIGWDEQRVKRLIAVLDARTDNESNPADEAAADDGGEQAVITVPADLLPEIRQLLAWHKTVKKPIDEMVKNLPAAELLERAPAGELFNRISPEEFLKRLTAEERLKRVPAKERLKGLSVDDVLAALPPETRAKLAQRLREKDSLSPSGGE
jgi:hypothetical protein